MMGFINSMFTGNNQVTATIEGLTNAGSNTTGYVTGSWSTIATVEGLFWRGSLSDAVVSEKFRAEVDAVLVVDYEDLSAAVPADSRITIASIKYSVVYNDDIGSQNKVWFIPLKKYTGAD